MSPIHCPECGTLNSDEALFCQGCGADFREPGIKAGLRPARSPYAGFWRRLAAFLIDWTAISTAGFALFLFAFPPAEAWSDPLLARAAWTLSVFGVFALGIVFPWLYWSLMESSGWQATLGKMALGLVVTDVAGNRVSFSRASARHWSKALSALILMIGFIMAGFTAKRQGLHDILAGCLVVLKKP